jgi:hypothetical protein
MEQDIKSQVARIDERTMNTATTVTELKDILERNRIEAVTNNSELKKMLSDSTSTIHSKIDTHYTNQSLINKSHSDGLTENRRDHTWMYGIFLVVWGGLFGWIKYK